MIQLYFALFEFFEECGKGIIESARPVAMLRRIKIGIVNLILTYPILSVNSIPAPSTPKNECSEYDGRDSGEGRFQLTEETTTRRVNSQWRVFTQILR